MEPVKNVYKIEVEYSKSHELYSANIIALDFEEAIKKARALVEKLPIVNQEKNLLSIRFLGSIDVE